MKPPRKSRRSPFLTKRLLFFKRNAPVHERLWHSRLPNYTQVQCERVSLTSSAFCTCCAENFSSSRQLQVSFDNSARVPKAVPIHGCCAWCPHLEIAWRLRGATMTFPSFIDNMTQKTYSGHLQVGSQSRTAYTRPILPARQWGSTTLRSSRSITSKFGLVKSSPTA